MLAAEGGVEAGPPDPQMGDQVGHGRRLVPPLPEQVERLLQDGVRIELLAPCHAFEARRTRTIGQISVGCGTNRGWNREAGRIPLPARAVRVRPTPPSDTAPVVTPSGRRGRRPGSRPPR